MIGIICFVFCGMLRIMDYNDFVNGLRAAALGDEFPHQTIADFLMLGDPDQPDADVPHILQLYGNIKRVVLSNSFDQVMDDSDDSIHPILNLINQTNCQQNFDSNYITSLQDMHFFYSDVSIDNALRDQDLLAQRMRQVIG